MDSNKLVETEELANREKLKTRHIEMEQDLHREKPHIIEAVTNEQQKDIQSQKRRKDGMDTIAKLLQETQQDLILARKKNKALELSVRFLQNKLTQSGMNPNVELEDEEVFIPGPSKEIMDNLVRENSRLLSITRNLGDPEEVHQLRQQLQNEQESVESLKAELKDRLNLNDKMLKDLETQKNQVITELQMKIDSLSEKNKSQERLQELLNEDPTNLRQQLSAVALTCQQMAEKMERVKGETEASHSPRTSPSVGFQVYGQDQLELTRLKEENTKLQATVKNLHEMNQRWKIYNDQREEYVHKLQIQLQVARGSPIEEEIKKKYEGLLIASRQQLESTMAEKAQLQSQVDQLGENMKTIEEAFSVQGEELRRVTQQLQHFQTHEAPSGHDIDALKAQIQICTEDFESERKDREKAQDKLSQAEQDNQNLRRQINHLQKELQHYAASVNSTARPQFQSMNIQSTGNRPPMFGRDPMTMYNIEPEVRLNARGGQSRQQRDIGLLGEDVADHPQTVMEDGASSAALVSRGSKKTSSNTPPHRKLIDEIGLLQCPKCRKEYEAHQHNELLEHIDICC